MTSSRYAFRTGWWQSFVWNAVLRVIGIVGIALLLDRDPGDAIIWKIDGHQGRRHLPVIRVRPAA